MVSPVAYDEVGEVIVVGGTEVKESISLGALGERIETGWEHRTLCKKRRNVAMSSPRVAFHTSEFLSPFPACLLSVRHPCSWAGMKGQIPAGTLQTCKRDPLQDKTPVWTIPLSLLFPF